MKTAISIPDQTFDEASRRAAALGISRSAFFTVAAQNYLRQLDAESLTEQINAAAELVGADDSSDDAVAASRRHLATIDDEW